MKDRSIKTEEDESDVSDRLLLKGDGETEDVVPRWVGTSGLRLICCWFVCLQVLNLGSWRRTMREEPPGLCPQPWIPASCSTVPPGRQGLRLERSTFLQICVSPGPPSRAVRVRLLGPGGSSWGVQAEAWIQRWT